MGFTARVRRELHIFLFALTFLTRIRSPLPLEFSRELLNRASRYFPLVGWFVGLISAGVFAWASLLVPAKPAIVMAMVASILATGAFHEDGLADTFDGFARASTRRDILAAMKDSRLGPPGMLAITSVLLVKFVLLANLSNAMIIAVLLTAHPLSRAASASMIYFGNYTRGDSGKSRLMAVGMTRRELCIALAGGLVPTFIACCLFADVRFVWSAGPAFLTAWLGGIWFKYKLEGFTGDCLGAVQQIAELAIYATLGFALPSL